jgi:hypothetical protein
MFLINLPHIFGVKSIDGFILSKKIFQYLNDFFYWLRLKQINTIYIVYNIQHVIYKKSSNNFKNEILYT